MEFNFDNLLHSALTISTGRWWYLNTVLSSPPLVTARGGAASYIHVTSNEPQEYAVMF